MSTRINPPMFGKGKTYERFKQELLAWREITDLRKDKQGIAVALSLPEDDESNIREKVFDQLNLEDLKSLDGLTVLINFLDQHLAKDDLSDSLEKFEDFEDYKRLEGQSITEFVAMFDSKYRKIEKKNMTLPPEILAFKILRKANISKEEKLLVLTGMNYDNKKTLYEEAKKSLKKFKGNENESYHSQTSIKLEPAFLAANEEALLAAGYSKIKDGYNKYQKNYGREIGRGLDQGRQGKFSKRENHRGEFGAENRKELKKNINPSGPDGRPLTCKSCGSFRHLLQACPDSWENMMRVHHVEEEQAVLFTGYDTNEIRRLGRDARNCAVLDSACSSTVCGISWMHNYIGSLDKTDQDKVIKCESQRVFKFGGGTRLISRGEFSIPAIVAGKTVTIKTDVVESEIPLLLSRTAMKKAAIKMDLENDTAMIMGQEVTLNLTTSGHYCIPIDKTEGVLVENICADKLDYLKLQERNKIPLKLHRQFAHPVKINMVALQKDAGLRKDDNHEELEQIEYECDQCKVYDNISSIPVEGTSMVVKTPSNIMNALTKQSVGNIGVMESLLTDNEGELNSKEIREITSIINIRKQEHAFTDMMLAKVQEDNPKVKCQTLLSWACMAQNSLQMWNDYSSHQLVFDQNPNMPNIMSENLPALQGSTSSQAFSEHLNILQATRRAFIQSEADERARRALRNKVRASEQVFEHGDRVFYKREGLERWLGPGKVVFQDGKVVCVRHGLYGLKDIARQFYLSIKEEVVKFGCEISKMDPAIFVLHANGKLSGIICSHVDNFLHASDEKLERILTSLRKRFVAGKIEERNFDNIGFRVIQRPREILLDQSKYVENIKSQPLDSKRMQHKEDILLDEEQSSYRQIIGQINWAVQGTRPDMAFGMIDLSTKLREANVGDLSRAVKTANRLKDVRSLISFPNLSTNVDNWRIVVFTDASLCNINNGTGSTAAYVVWLADHQGKCCPLDWHTNKIKRVVRSTIAAEALSLQEGLESGYYYRQMIEDILKLHSLTIPIVAYVDNKSVIDAVYSTKLVDDKRLRVDIAAISESLSRREVREIRWCPGRYHLADCMTKRGASGYNLLEVFHRGQFSEYFY